MFWREIGVLSKVVKVVLLLCFAASVVFGGQASAAAQIALGFDHSLVRTSDGSVWSWGNNQYGQLGDGTTTSRLTPAQVGGLTTPWLVAAGQNHSLALSLDETVQAWGLNSNGQLGDGATTNRLTPVSVGGLTFIGDVNGGGAHTVALNWPAGTVWVWGSNQYGQMGDGTTATRLSPVQVPGLTNVARVSAGGLHTAALLNDGSLWVWGSNQYGQVGDGTTTQRLTPVTVTGLTGVTGIALGFNHSVALVSETVWTWGYNSAGQLGDGTTTQRLSPVQVTALTNVKNIVAGYSHTLALKYDGTVWAWGDNTLGQLGDGTNTSRLTPVQVPGLTNVRYIATGHYHSLAVKADGTLWAWGYNSSGQLGDGTTTNRSSPAQVAYLNLFGANPRTGSLTVSVSPAGAQWRVDGGAWQASGATVNGLTAGSHTVSFSAVPDYITPLNQAATITAGQTTSVVVTYGGSGSLTVTISPAGANAQGARWNVDGGVWQPSGATVTGLTAGSHTVSFNTMPYSYAQPANQTVTITQGQTTTATGAYTYIVGATLALPQIALGFNHSAALTTDGSVWTWGANTNGQLGDGTTTQRLAPVKVNGTGATGSIGAATGIALGFNHSMALLSTSAWAWGNNQYGQLGDGTTTQSLTPLLSGGGAGGLQDVATGGNHSAFLSGSWFVDMWGSNSNGQLGNGTTTQSLDPIYLSALGSANSIALGFNHSAAVVSGAVRTWGSNSSGQLGDGTTTQRLTPVTVTGLTGVTGVALGFDHSVALVSDVVWTWGGNANGQLGDGTTINRLTPVAVTGLTNVKSMSAGNGHTVAVKYDGTVWTWGSNSNGQLGDGTTINRLTPVQVPGLTNVQSVAAGGYYTMAIKKDGTVWAWGHNSNGQLGDGTTTDRSSPVQVAYLNLKTLNPTTGSLTVSVSPAGAQWRVDGGAWQASGATVNGLTAGSHTVSFSAVADYITPLNQAVTITDGQTTSVVVTYTAIPTTGSLTVDIIPSGAVRAGAQWNVDGGAWQASGATVSSLSAGSHTVSFNTVTGYTSPTNQTVTVTAGQTATATGTYTAVAAPTTGSLTVTLSPAGAITAGAQWSVDGGAWQVSDATVSSLTAGSHTVSFNTVMGYTAPANQTVTVTAGQTATATGTYTVATVPTGSLAVTIFPVEAVTAGAQWRVDGGAWQASGSTLAGITAGSHTLSFSIVTGYTSPVNQTVTITAGGTATGIGTYTAVSGLGSLKVTMSPTTAVDAGAVWSIDGGTSWNLSGDTLTDLAAGSYTVAFSDVTGYTTPADKVVTVANGRVAISTGAYKQEGSLIVTITPQAAVDAGAQWSIDGGNTWNDSGFELTGLAPGSYTVTFDRAVTGYSPPADKTVRVASAPAITRATGIYTTGYTVLAKVSTGGSATPTKKVVTDTTTPVTFKVTARPGYTMSSTFGGTCAAGTWDATTFMYSIDPTTVTEACYVSFTFTKKPTVTPASATNIMQTEATLNARVNPENDSTTVTFEYATDAAYLASSGVYSSTLSAAVLTGGRSLSVAASATGLTCNTKYHFRVVAVNSVDTTNGADRTFKTAACKAPIAATLGSSNINATGATLKGYVNPNRAATTVTFEYVADPGTTAPSTYGSTASAGSLSGGASRLMTASLTGLTCGTKYHFRVVATNAVNTTNGLDKTFTTSACADRATDSNMVKAPASDFDGDGKSDIVFRDAVSGQTAVWMMNGATVTSNALTSMNAGVYTSTTGWQAQGIGDFDGDGKNDLLWRDAESGQLAVWTMNGATVVNSATTSVNPSSGWLVQGIGDFNGDGKSDILFRNTTTGETSVWFMNGAVKIGGRRTSSTAGAYTSTTGWQVHGVGDFNGDGKSDILWRHAGTGKTIVWFMNGATVTNRAVTTVQAGAYTSTSGWQIQGSGDFNGDGKSDILWRDAQTGRMAIWMMSGAKVSSGSYTSVDAGVYTSATGLHVSAIADYDGDGKSDILLRDAETGQTRVWVMNGSQVTSGTATDVNPGVYTSATGWRVVSEETVR